MTIPEPATPGGIGELLRGQRRALGITQEELAERAGVSPRSISELERGGAHIPRRDTLALLTRALGIEGTERDALEAMVAKRRSAMRSSGEPLTRRHPFAATDWPSHQQHHNIARALTRFIGREQDLEQLVALLASNPLVTLVGPGGVGKTRLAEEVVRASASNFEAGCWMIELAGISDPDQVPVAIAHILELRQVRSENIQRALIDYIGDKHLLLVLDNCEHLIEACAEIVASLLSRCPRLQVLATSREPLSIAGETRWQVLPLELPSTSCDVSFDELRSNPAVQLFVDRAAAVDDVRLTAQNASAVARICVSLDGIPLALEIAAASTRILSLNELAERLEADVGLLSARSRLVPARHRTLRATIDWSHDLLGTPERVLLRRLSVFAGGWALDAAEEVCSGPGEGIERPVVLDLLAELLDKSLVVVDARGAAARYRLLEPVRHYASERLEAAGETERYQQRHALYFLELARTGPAYAAGPQELHAIERFEQDHLNVRAALQWALGHDETESALTSASSLFRFWERRGHFQEGISWLEQALARDDAGSVPAQARGGALNALAFLYWRGGAADRAEPLAREALEISTEGDHRPGIAHAHLNLGMSAYLQHDYQRAEAHLEESVRHARESGRLPMLSVALAFLGRVRMAMSGRAEHRAVAVVAESLSIAELAESQYASGHAVATWGDLRWAEGDVGEAVQCWNNALILFSGLADPRGTAGCLERVGVALLRQQCLAAAAWMFGAADAQHARLGMQLRQSDCIDHAHFAAYSEQESARHAFPDEWTSGQSASVQQSVTRAIGDVEKLATGSANENSVRV